MVAYTNSNAKAICSAVRTAIARERRMAASLIRFHFHDCFVQPILDSEARKKRFDHHKHECSYKPASSFYSQFQSLIDLFGGKGLSAKDMVALSGSPTIGQAQCITFRGRIYNNASDIDAGFASTRRRRCPANLGYGDGNMAAMDLVTPNSFDNNYYKNLMKRRVF
ncbi:Peroxidase 5 [Hibiscus syriacus]|uniref:peroxidase n=1 Tax=Hibiscus syriacus TaxID=106335 RepID=A0A6A2WYG1_HIBSY|nr:Peroxidase 5 [Hibiscus syriacus]